MESAILDENQLVQLHKFHRFIFENVLNLRERQLQFDLELSKLKYLIVPLQTKTDKIDFGLVNKMTSAPGIDWVEPQFRLLPTTEEPATDFGQQKLCFLHSLPASVWKQVVWIPSVLHRLHGMLLAEELRVRISTETKIEIEFIPTAVNTSTVWRPLESHLKNYRSENRSFSALRSLNSSTLKETTNLDINFMWNLKYDELNNKVTPDNSMDMSTLAQVIATTNISSSNSSGSNSRNSSSRRSLTEEQLPSSMEDLKREWVELTNMNSLEAVQPSKNLEIQNVSFDVADSSLISDFGPSPGLILEALTLAKAHDGFDKERMETIGDSFLKLTISIYVYGEASNDRCDERLTLLRSHQINIKHLFNLGSNKGIGQLFVAQRFDLKANYLPSGFQTPVSEAEPISLHVQQSVSEKNVADCMKALTGVYLLTTGIKGPIIVMDWMGLKTVPKLRVIDFNEKNGFPVLTPMVELNSNQMESNEIARLYSGLETFEKRLGYTFKHKHLLIEALSHASYLPNRITNCYQKLNF